MFYPDNLEWLVKVLNRALQPCVVPLLACSSFACVGPIKYSVVTSECSVVTSECVVHTGAEAGWVSSWTEQGWREEETRGTLTLMYVSTHPAELPWWLSG